MCEQSSWPSQLYSSCRYTRKPNGTGFSVIAFEGRAYHSHGGLKFNMGDVVDPYGIERYMVER